MSVNTNYTLSDLFWDPLPESERAGFGRSSDPVSYYHKAERDRIQELYVDRSLLYIDRLIDRLQDFKYEKREKELLTGEYSEKYISQNGLENLCRIPIFLKYLQNELKTKLVSLIGKDIHEIKESCHKLTLAFIPKLFNISFSELRFRIQFDLKFHREDEQELKPCQFSNLLEINKLNLRLQKKINSFEKLLAKIESACMQHLEQSTLDALYESVEYHQDLLLIDIKRIEQLGFRNLSSSWTNKLMSLLHTM